MKFSLKDKMKITRQMLVDHRACEDQVELFKKTFPDGATWPDDMKKASRAGLNLQWAARNLKLSGVVQLWFFDGTLWYEYHYRHGKLHDTDVAAERWWRSDGTLEYELHYRNGERIEK